MEVSYITVCKKTRQDFLGKFGKGAGAWSAGKEAILRGVGRRGLPNNRRAEQEQNHRSENKGPGAIGDRGPQFPVQLSLCLRELGREIGPKAMSM